MNKYQADKAHTIIGQIEDICDIIRELSKRQTSHIPFSSGTNDDLLLLRIQEYLVIAKNSLEKQFKELYDKDEQR